MVPLMHERASHRSRSAVEVLVVAPHGEIRCDVMQAQRQVADRMCKIEADPRTVQACGAGDRIEVEGLAGAVLHAGPKHQRQARAMLGDGTLDRRERDRAIGFVRLYFHQARGGGEAMEADLRLHGVAIGGERAGFHQDHRALRGRPVEADHHQVQVHAQGIHRHHFAGQRTDHAGQLCAHQAVVGQPLRRAGEVAFHGQFAPLLHHFLHGCLRTARLQAQRVADKVGLLAATMARNQEFVAQRTQRIGGVQGNGVGAAEQVGHGRATGCNGAASVAPGGRPGSCQAATSTT
ncbi:hypothetical protein G6F57_018141 [Rhizopus arrhizus]|nr:hypothetical protein G6F57_018141 [Rhizopus arrhizus]